MAVFHCGEIIVFAVSTHGFRRADFKMYLHSLTPVILHKSTNVAEPQFHPFHRLFSRSNKTIFVKILCIPYINILKFNKLPVSEVSFLIW